MPQIDSYPVADDWDDTLVALGEQGGATKQLPASLFDRASFDVAKLTVYGHSLAFGGGASEADKDVTTHLASMLKAREVPRAVGGAILHWHQAGATGDGGYAHVLQTDLRPSRASTTLNGAVSAGAATITVTSATGIAVGSLLHVGTGDTGSSGGEVLYVTNVAGAVLTVRKLDGTANTARAHGNGEPVYVVPTGYIHLNPLYLAWFGANDLAASPVSSSAFPDLADRFKDPYRLILGRMRCSDVFENDHASCVYTGTWGAPAASTASNSGANIRQATATDAVVTIHVPDNFPGGAINIGFAASGTNPPTTTAPVLTFTVDGVSAGTKDAPSIYTAKNNGFSKRISGLAAGRHLITVQLTTLGSGSVYFDWWGIEAQQPPIILAPNLVRPRDYTLWPGWANTQRTATLTGAHGSGTTSWTVSSTTGWVVGSTVTFEEGTANQETLEVLTVPTGTTFTTAASTIAHGNASAVVAGIHDADFLKMNTRIQEVIAEFDERVVYVDLDAVVNKTNSYFIYDGAHFSDLGHAVLTEALYDAIRRAMTPTIASFSSAPSAPLPAAINFTNNPGSAAGANTQWTNMPAALTELFGAAAHRKYVDFRRAFEARFVVGVQVAGASGAGLRIQYSIDGGTTWKYLFRTAAYAEDTTHEAILTSTGMKDSGWRPIAVEALVDNVQLRVVGINGNATADPTFGTIDLYFR